MTSIATKPSSIDEYVAALPEPLRATGRAVQAIIDAELPETDAGLIWHGHPVWRIGGEPACLLKAYSSYVTFGLWKGHALADPNGRLQSGRAAWRT